MNTRINTSSFSYFESSSLYLFEKNKSIRRGMNEANNAMGMGRDWPESNPQVQ